MKLRVLSTLAVAAAACAATIGAADARNLALEDWLDWERAAGPKLSPDGETIIYTRRHVDKFKDRWSSEVWTLTADGDRHRFLTDGGGVEWSPSGDRIAFLRGVGEDDNRRTQLFVRHMDAEGAVSQITRDEVEPNSYAWGPKGRVIAFRAQTPLEPEFKISLPKRPKGASWTDDPMVAERLHYRIDRVGLKDGFDHLFIVPADGGTPRQI
ncbi:MAG: S9 family peptidase, partial [Pseudomonadota bacterium]